MNVSSELSEAGRSTRKESSTINLGMRWTEDSEDVSYKMVNETGGVTFFNRNVDKSGYTLDNGFRLAVSVVCNIGTYDLLDPVSFAVPGLAP